MLTTFATQAAIAIRSVDLVRTLKSRTAELGRKVDQLEAIGAVIDAVNSSLDLDEVLTRIVRHAVQLSETDGGSIMEFDEETRQIPGPGHLRHQPGRAGPAAAHVDRARGHVRGPRRIARASAAGT